MIRGDWMGEVKAARGKSNGRNYKIGRINALNNVDLVVRLTSEVENATKEA